MFDYLEQFKRLPKELREKISSPAAMTVLSELEKKYNLALAATAMKVMVKIVSIRDLPSHFVSDFSLTPEAARNLSNELKERLFFVVAGYLGLKAAPSNDEKTVAEIIKNSQLSFPSTDLNNRARNLVLTYLRGVRSKIDARDVLEKPINNGGLNLSREEATRLLNEVDHFSFRKTTEVTEQVAKQELASQKTTDSLQKIIVSHDQQGAYDLKKELASGRTASLLSAPDIKQLEVKTTDLDVTSQAKEAGGVAPKSVDQLSGSKELEKGLLSQELESRTPNELDDLVQQISVDKKSEKLSIDAAQSEKMSLADKDELTAKGLSSVPTKTQISVNETAFLTPTPPTDVLPVSRSQTSTSFAPPPKKSLFARLFSKRKKETTIKIETGRPKEISPQSSSQFRKTSLLSKKITRTPEITPTTDFSEGGQTNKLTVKLATGEAITTKQTEQLSESIREKNIDKNITEVDKLAPNFIEKKSRFFHRAAAGSDFKPKVEDIKAAPKIMGPIEELRYLDLVNFRRLGPPPEEATNKIKAKIKLMEREGYDRRLAAVAAWRKSPVSRLYIMIGQEAVSQGITMKEAALARKEKKQDYLSWEEIRAIVELNSSLMF